MKESQYFKFHIDHDFFRRLLVSFLFFRKHDRK